MEVIDVLRRVDMLSGLSDEQLVRLAKLATRRTVHAGDVVVAEGEPPTEFFVIESGQLSVTLEPLPGVGPAEEIAIVDLGRGQIVGEIALIDRGPRSATVRCLSDEAMLLVFDPQEVLSLCESDFTIGYPIMKNLAADMAFKFRQRNIRERVLRAPR